MRLWPNLVYIALALSALLSAGAFIWRVIFLMQDRNYGTQFFSPASGGDPVAYQHLLWFFGHPETWGLIIPTFIGLVGIIFAYGHFIQRKAYHSLIFLTLTLILGILCLAAFFLYAQHRYTMGFTPFQASGIGGAGGVLAIHGNAFGGDWVLYPPLSTGEPSFTERLSFLMDDPQLLGWGAVFILSVLGLILVRFRSRLVGNIAALILIAGWLVLILVGGIAGAKLAGAGIDHALHDTYYVIAHFHYLLTISVPFVIFILTYLLIRPIIGVSYNHILGALQAGLYVFGVGLVLLPQVFIGLQGMPRRYVDYQESFALLNMLSSTGAFVTLLSMIIFAICLIEAIYRRIKHGKHSDQVHD